MDPRHFTKLVREYPDEPENEMYKRYRKWRRKEGRREALLEASAQVDPNFLSVGGLDSNGDAVVLVEGARFETGNNDAYSALICARLDSVLSADSLRRLVVLVDVRPGHGWPNHPPTRFVSFIKQTLTLVSDMYPERLKTIVVYPLPGLLSFFLSNCILVLLDKVTRDKVKIFGFGSQQRTKEPQLLECDDKNKKDEDDSGLLSPSSKRRHRAAKIVDPCPASDLSKFVSLDMLPPHARSRHYGLD